MRSAVHEEKQLERCGLAAPHHAERAERGARFVVALTTGMMVLELVVGYATRSLALTADGWHMATHAGALSISALAYWFARTRAGDRSFTFGTGKVHALAGYTSAVLLMVVAASMIYEAVVRFFHPAEIHYREALPVACLGLLVNLASIKLLGHDHAHDDAHRSGHDAHRADHDDHGHTGHDHDHGHHDGHDHGHDDHNHRAAYMHVVADAFTSVLAIAALLAGRYLGWGFLDPVMGIIGGAVVLKWGAGLCRGAGRQLLDVVPKDLREEHLRRVIEAIDDVRIADLHVWEAGPGRRSCIVSIVTSTPKDATYYHAQILKGARLAHLTVEVRACVEGHASRAASPSTVTTPGVPPMTTRRTVWPVGVSTSSSSPVWGDDTQARSVLAARRGLTGAAQSNAPTTALVDVARPVARSTRWTRPSDVSATTRASVAISSVASQTCPSTATGASFAARASMSQSAPVSSRPSILGCPARAEIARRRAPA